MRSLPRGIFASRAILVLSTAALALASLSCGGDDSNPVTPPSGGADVTISIVADAGTSSYSPSPHTVSVGQTVAWKNNRSVVHTATADGGQWDTGDINPGATSNPITMNTPGTFAYHCAHHSMSGSLTVQ